MGGWINRLTCSVSDSFNVFFQLNSDPVPKTNSCSGTRKGVLDLSPLSPSSLCWKVSFCGGFRPWPLCLWGSYCNRLMNCSCSCICSFSGLLPWAVCALPSPVPRPRMFFLAGAAGTYMSQLYLLRLLPAATLSSSSYVAGSYPFVISCIFLLCGLWEDLCPSPPDLVHRELKDQLWEIS